MVKRMRTSNLKVWAPMLGCGLPLVLMLSVCASVFDSPRSTELEQAPKRVTFQGFLLPGTAADAKASGFNECTSDYYAATCINKTAKLMGVSAAAMVRMPLENGAMPANLEKLHYDDIEFQLPLIDIKYPCKNDTAEVPLACDKDSPTRDLQKILLSQGWKAREWRGNRTYFKANTPVAIAVTAYAPGVTNGVSLMAVTNTEVREGLSKIALDSRQREKRVSAAQEFQQKMSAAK